MSNTLLRIFMGVGVAALIFALWNLSVWADSFLTMRTPLYYSAHWWASVVVSVFIGIAFWAKND